MKMNKIAVTTDFSDLAARAYPTALEVANKFDAALHLVHTAVSVPPFYYVHEGFPTDIPQDAHLEEIRSQLEEEARHPNFQQRTVEPHLIYLGFPQEALSTFSRKNDIDLIVAATHGRTGLGHFVLGSYVEKLVRLSSTPVLVCRETADGRGEDGYKGILVPFDFSVNAEAVFPMVRFLSEAYGAHFTFVYVLEPIPYTITNHSSPALASIRDAAFAAPEVAKRRFDALKKEQLPGVDVELVTLEGMPVNEILNLANDLTRTSLFIVESPRPSGLRRSLSIRTRAQTLLRRWAGANLEKGTAPRFFGLR